MDKFKKFDNIDIFPDVEIIPDIQDIVDEPTPVEPTIRRENNEIFKDSKPVVSEDRPSEIEGDTEDAMVNEILPPPKRKGRGKDKVKRVIKQSQAQKDALARGRKNRWEKDRAHRAAYAEQEKKKVIQLEADRVELIARKLADSQKKIELVKEEKPVSLQTHKPGRPNSIPSDFSTFCDYMDRYKTSRSNAKAQAHPNKMVNKNLLPRAPMISAPRTNSRPQTTNVLDSNYAINMLGAQRRRNNFKDPFNRG